MDQVMPLIVLNLGGEMVYILNQRLQAQSVQDDKAKKVLLDVARAMFSPVFVDQLFAKQEMYTHASTKQIFEKLAHSSIMRLNKSSMDKLYDLMMMGFKYQIISCNSPQQYLQVTLNHLESMKILINHDEASNAIQRAVDQCIAMYTSMTNGQLLLVKQSLFRFFMGKRVKVSLFLQQSLQNNDGTLVLSHVGELPYGTELPGTARYYEGHSVAKTLRFDSVVKIGCTEVTDVINVTLRLGLNMYAKDAGGATQDAQAKALKALSSSGAKGGADDSGRSDALSAGGSGRGGRGGITASTAKAELTMLADLLGGVGGSGAKHDAAEAKPFKINLFPETANMFRMTWAKGGDDMAIESDSKDRDAEDTYIQIDIDGAADSKTMADYMKDLNLKDDDDDFKAGAKGGGGVDDDEDDLLALMDSAK